MKTALIVTDIQRDYIDGKLPLPYSESLIKKINKIQKKFDLVCFTKNEFDNEPKTKDFITISDTGFYCVKNTEGSEFPENLNINDNIFIRSYNDSFSSLNALNGDKSLIDFLKENEITHIFICGLPADYSIKYTVLESIKHFKTYIMVDMIKTINPLDKFIKMLMERKINFLDSEDFDIFVKEFNTKPGNMKNTETKKEEKGWLSEDWWI